MRVAWSGRSANATVVLVTMAVLLASSLAAAHEGHAHDHVDSEGAALVDADKAKADAIAAAEVELRSDTEIVCRKCGMRLTRRRTYVNPPPSTAIKGVRHEPALGPSGVVLTFQNQHKKVHGVATFSSLDNAKISHAASSKDTYFPGYTWRVASCHHCHAHVGWLFEKESPKSSRGSIPPPPAPPVPPPPPAKGVDHPQRRGKKDLSALANLCQTLPQGWWTYEWCHQSHVRQFHRDADGTVTSDWSLGQFDALGSMKLDAKTSHGARQPLFIHKFEGGQICDETGTRRRTEVHFCCCNKDRGIHVESISEPSMCEYKMVVCVPQLCDGNDGGPAPNAGPTHPTGYVENSAASASGVETQRDGGDGKGPGRRFFGLLWGNVLATDDQPMWWVDAVEPMTALSH